MWKDREHCQKFLHFGLQRSGTNYFEGLVYRYFEVWCRNRGSGPNWKHNMDLPELEDDILYFVVSKNPYTWIESIAFRNPMDFVPRQRLYPANKGNDEQLMAGKNKLNVVNLTKTWNHFHKNWADISPTRKVMLINYEDMLESQMGIIMAISLYFSLPVRENAITYTSSETGILDKEMDSQRKQYYLNQTPTQLTPYQVEAINDQLDKEVMEKFGYSFS